MPMRSARELQGAAARAGPGGQLDPRLDRILVVFHERTGYARGTADAEAGSAENRPEPYTGVWHAAASNFKANAIRRRGFRCTHNLGRF